MLARPLKIARQRERQTIKPSQGTMAISSETPNYYILLPSWGLAGESAGGLLRDLRLATKAVQNMMAEMKRENDSLRVELLGHLKKLQKAIRHEMLG